MSDSTGRYFSTEGVNGRSGALLREDPTRPGELLLVADAGTVVRVQLDEDRAVKLGWALLRWYIHPESREEPQDTITQYRDGMVYGFTAPPEG
jgi:hypothetical protein